LPIKTNTMYIILNKSSEKAAIIKDKTEIAHYIGQPIWKVRRELAKNIRWEIGEYIIITPDYIQSKSNSGGRRDKY